MCSLFVLCTKVTQKLCPKRTSLIKLGKDPERSALVICHRDGAPIQTVKRSFQSLLEFAGVPIMREGMARTIYSLRHFYATQRLSHDTDTNSPLTGRPALAGRNSVGVELSTGV